MTIRYEITVYTKDDSELVYRTTGTRSNSSIPYILLDTLGNRYGNCTVIFHNLTEGWKAEKDFD